VYVVYSFEFTVSPLEGYRMSVYSDKEMSRAVYYPACGVDFGAIVELSNRSDLFIYVDWAKDYWPQSTEEYIEYLQNLELAEDDGCEQHGGDQGFENLFQPISENEVTERIEEAQAGEKEYGGLKREIIEELWKVNDELCPDSIELLEDNAVPIDGIGRVVIDEQIQFPLGFEMTQYERERYDERMRDLGSFEPWAREFKLRRTIGQQECYIRLLYIRGEGIATYCALFASGRIAPEVLVTVGSGPGLGGGFIRLEDPKPEGIMSRLLEACEKRPELWVRGRDCKNPEDGLYNILVEEYTGWAGVAAFRQQNEVKNR